MDITATFKCVSGGHGWGETGSTLRITYPNMESWGDVLEKAHLAKPGGWILISLTLKGEEVL